MPRVFSLAGVAEDGVDAGLVVDAGGDVGAVPHAVGLGLGDVILENRKAAGAGGIDGRVGDGGRKGGGDDHKAQSQHKAQSKDSLEMFHDEYLHKFEFRFVGWIRLFGASLFVVPHTGTVAAPVAQPLFSHAAAPFFFRSRSSRASAAAPARLTPIVVPTKPGPPVSGIVKPSVLTAVTAISSAPL